MLSMNADEDSVLKTLRAGAAGYLVKTADPAELELAVRAVVRGEKFLSSAVSEHVVAACLGRISKEQTSLERLTPRHREVLQLIAEGQTTKKIAKELDVSVKTAESYRGIDESPRHPRRRQSDSLCHPHRLGLLGPLTFSVLHPGSSLAQTLVLPTRTPGFP